jgi:hypothetical protein
MVGLGSQRRPGDWSYEHGVCGMFMCMGLRRGTASSRDISRGIRNDLLAQRETVILPLPREEGKLGGLKHMPSLQWVSGLRN